MDYWIFYNCTLFSFIGFSINNKVLRPLVSERPRNRPLLAIT